MKSLEICAGAGGQALGLELAGFEHVGLVEIDADCRTTLRLNRPHWNVLEEGDLTRFKKVASRFAGVDLLAGGLPCPPFSVAGRQLGARDERNLFPDFLTVVEAVQPKAVMLENVKGLLSPMFAPYLTRLETKFNKMGYQMARKLVQASNFGVVQLRPRLIIVAFKNNYLNNFEWPQEKPSSSTVGEMLHDLMRQDGWKGADRWRSIANGIAPTIVGGSKKHGGPDLGPTRSKLAWAALGVNGHTIAKSPPGADSNPNEIPRLTVKMVARLQGFPDDWQFSGTKTSAYRQVGNAFPPPVAKAVGEQIRHAISVSLSTRKIA